MKTLDVDTKEALPVHLILGASEIARIKTDQAPCVGSPGEPVAELTRFGWTIMSPGKEPDLSNLLVTQTSRVEYEDLCRLDVLGLKTQPWETRSKLMVTLRNNCNAVRKDCTKQDSLGRELHTN